MAAAKELTPQTRETDFMLRAMGYLAVHKKSTAAVRPRMQAGTLTFDVPVVMPSSITNESKI